MAQLFWSILLRENTKLKLQHNFFQLIVLVTAGSTVSLVTARWQRDEKKYSEENTFQKVGGTLMELSVFFLEQWLIWFEYLFTKYVETTSNKAYQFSIVCKWLVIKWILGNPSRVSGSLMVGSFSDVQMYDVQTR